MFFRNVEVANFLHYCNTSTAGIGILQKKWWYCWAMFDCARGEEYRTNIVGKHSLWLGLPLTFHLWLRGPKRIPRRILFKGAVCNCAAFFLLQFFVIVLLRCLVADWWFDWKEWKENLSCSPSSTDTVGEEGPSVGDAGGRLVVDPAERGDPVCALWCAASSRYFVSYLHSGKSTHSVPL